MPISQLYRLIRYPAIYALASLLLVLAAMYAASWQIQRSMEADREPPLIKAVETYADTLEAGTTNSRAMGAAILLGLTNQTVKQIAQGELPPDVPAARSITDALRTQFSADVFFVNAQSEILTYSGEENLRAWGRKLSFFPGIKLAMQGTSNVYPAVDQDDTDRGIYLAAPIHAASNTASKPIGAVVVKIGADKLDALLKSWDGGIAVLLSPQGVVFSTSREDWLFRMAGVMSTSQIADARDSRQFGITWEHTTPVPLPFTVNTSEASIDGVRYAVRSHSLDWHDTHGDWKLVMLEQRAPWWTDWRALGITGLAGLITAWVLFWFYALVRNAAVLEKMNAQLQHNDTLLKESQLIAGLGSYILDIPTGSFSTSDTLDRLFGLDETYEHTIKGWTALIHPDDRAAVLDYFHNEVLGQRKAFNKEYRIIRHDDQACRWIYALGKLKFDAQGQALELHGTVQDITNRKQAELQLNNLLTLNKTILESSPAGIAVYTASGPCIMANEAYASTIGTTADEILKQDFRNNASWQRYGLLGFANQALETGSIIRHDVEGTTSFGRGIFVDCIFAPINISGKPHLLLIINDISERIAAERALTESMQQLQEKELAKSRFLAAAGHDLRQPLAAANLFIDALKFAKPTPEQNQIIQRLEQAMVTFNGLLDALLNISKLDSGIIRPEYTSINVSEIINWLDESFAPLAAEKKLGFKLHFQMKEPLAIRSDIGLVKSALMNLVSNAIKFTSEGAILISARRRGNTVLFQVWDSGMGIEAEYIERIFEEFYQINNPQRDRTSGLGLGLSIAKRALKLLDAEITCRSEIGHGTVFGFSLPLSDTSNVSAKPAATKTAQEVSISGTFAPGKRFVVVEDDALVAEALIKTLEALGGEVRHFHNAEDALRHGHIGHADYYIADFMLGGTLNGVQFLNQLRQQLGKPIHAVLMTGDTSPAFIKESANCAWPVLHKPVSLSKLIATLSPQ